jgi:L-cysteine desulfidase
MDRTIGDDMDNKDVEIFDGKSLSDLLKNIYDNSVEKKTQINKLTEELSKFVNRISDVAVISPIIKEYLDVGVKNDEQLIKIAQVAAKLVGATTKEGDEILSDKEKQDLLATINDTVKDLQVSNDSITEEKEIIDNKKFKN